MRRDLQEVPQTVRKYDVNLPAYVDKSRANLSGPATKRILEREFSESPPGCHERPASISEDCRKVLIDTLTDSIRKGLFTFLTPEWF